MLLFVFCQGTAGEYGELRREGFADAVVSHTFVMRLEESFACRIDLGILEQYLSGAERRDGRRRRRSVHSTPETSSSLLSRTLRRPPLSKNGCPCCFVGLHQSQLIDDAVAKLLRLLRCWAL